MTSDIRLAGGWRVITYSRSLQCGSSTFPCRMLISRFLHPSISLKCSLGTKRYICGVWKELLPSLSITFWLYYPCLWFDMRTRRGCRASHGNRVALRIHFLGFNGYPIRGCFILFIFISSSTRYTENQPLRHSSWATTTAQVQIKTKSPTQRQKGTHFRRPGKVSPCKNP